MATPKSNRQPPERLFENYIATLVTDASVGLTNVDERLFTRLSGSLPVHANANFEISLGLARGASSDLTPIGFDFEFNGTTYKHFVANTAGWLALADPAAANTNEVEGQVFLSGSTLIHRPENISLQNSGSSALLCPWFDTDTYSLSADTDQISTRAGFLFYPDRIKHTLIAPSSQHNEVHWGVRYHVQSNSPDGLRCIVRYDIHTDWTAADLGTAISFEVVLYANGTIEYRYVSRSALKDSLRDEEGAFCGIVLSGSNNFRDFSPDLGYRTDEREQYKYGGYLYDPSFEDQSFLSAAPRPYAHSLKPNLHWPGFAKAGAIITMQPPPLRRRILPRQLIRTTAARTTYPVAQRQGRQLSQPDTFDDRRSVNFLTGTIVNYPTTLRRFFGNTEPGVARRQDLFVGDFETTGAINRGAIQQFIEPLDGPAEYPPFVELNRLDQGSAVLEDPFIASGSTIELRQPLRSKTQVRLNLPVNFQTTMFATTSSIFYYNKRTARWELPPNAIPDLTDPNPYGDIGTERWFDDHKGFGPIGNPMMSGNLETDEGSTSYRGARDLTITNIRNTLRPHHETDTSSPFFGGQVTDFSKTVTLSSDYAANDDETFELPITQPFIIEKAVIEVPLACGPDWFNDVTRTFQPISSPPNYITSLQPQVDFGGPALTVALFNQLKLGNTTRRDLILTGTITHEFDNKSELVFAADPPITATYTIRPEGFLAYASAPGAVVRAQDVNGTNQFTGSVAVMAEATTTAGPIILIEQNHIGDGGTTGGNGEPEARSRLLDLLSLEKLPVTGAAVTGVAGVYDRERRMLLAYLDGFCRSAAELEPAGRSIFGKEFGTFQGNNLLAVGEILNPFHVPTSSITGQIQEVVDDPIRTGLAEGWRCRAMVSLASHFRSPYLVHPGDRLVLSISKTRPFIYSITSEVPNAPQFSGSITHDIKLASGSVNITLYGSMLQEGEEFHGTVGQPVASDAVHDIIGCEPVVDQFDVVYRGELSGSYTDYIVTGSLVTRIIRSDRTIGIQTGQRELVTSKINARLQDNSQTGVKSFDLQPWFERAGTPRVNPISDFTERFWDSFMPGIADALETEGAAIFIDQTFKDPKTDFGGTSYVPQPFGMTGSFAPSSSIGRIYFDSVEGSGFANELVDNANMSLNWNKAFPFEPRYSRVARQRDIRKNLIATNALVHQSYGSWDFVKINPTRVEGIIPGIVTYDKFPYPEHPSFINTPYLAFEQPIWYCDVNNGITGSLNVDDLARFMYGFGDLNVTAPTFAPLLKRLGTNNLPAYRDISNDIGYPTGDNGALNFNLWNRPFNHHYVTGPIIRGWKYGVYSGIPSYTRAHFRRRSFGQLRDMLEQRLFSRFFKLDDPGLPVRVKEGLLDGPVTVKFVDAVGNITTPENTQSSNLDLYATSSCPFFDGEIITNRTPITPETQNSAILTLEANEFGVTTIGGVAPVRSLVNTSNLQIIS